MNRKKLITALLAALLVVGAAIAVPLFSHNEAEDVEASGNNITQVPDTVDIELLCVGDIMVHLPQIPAARLEDGTYSFSDYFSSVQSYIKEADVAMCNFETTFGGEPYDGYPAFSTPDQLAYDAKKAGFDIAITANNHMNDRGAAGIERTLEVLKSAGFITTGSRQSVADRRYAMVRVKGVNIAVIAYTYQTPSQTDSVSINGTAVSPETAEKINSFSYEDIDAELYRIKAVADEARAEGADIIVMYYHWGEEYQLQANSWQHYIAEKTVSDIGADVIFASHPHNLQEAQYVEDVPVFFSLGNFISNQRTETLGADKRYTETGAIGKVGITYDRTSREVTGTRMGAVPIWVDKYVKNGKNVYTVIPLDNNMDNNAILAESGHLSRAKGALEDANGILKIDR